MRTTLDIEDDVLNAVKELSRRGGKTAGQIISDLARKGLRANTTRTSGSKRRSKNGVPVLRSRGDLITIQHIDEIFESEGI